MKTIVFSKVRYVQADAKYYATVHFHVDLNDGGKFSSAIENLFGKRAEHSSPGQLWFNYPTKDTAQEMLDSVMGKLKTLHQKFMKQALKRKEKEYERFNTNVVTTG